jgi:hypothetical protein
VTQKQHAEHTEQTHGFQINAPSFLATRSLLLSVRAAGSGGASSSDPSDDNTIALAEREGGERAHQDEQEANDQPTRGNKKRAEATEL